MSERREPTLADVLAAVTGLSDAVTKLRAAVMDRMDRLQDEVTALRADVTVNFGRTHKAEMVADNTRSEMRALSGVVNAMQKQIQHLQTEVRELRDRT